MSPDKWFREAGRSCVIAMAMLTLTSAASAEWKEKVLYSFQGIPDGATPAGGVVLGKNGNLYGATTDGGADSCAPTQCGTVFELVPPTKQGDAWTETVIHIFQGNANGDGNTPAGGVIFDHAGNLYGTTAYGGSGDCILLGAKTGCGTVYEIEPSNTRGNAWTEKVLYSFKGGKDGQLPQGDLVFDSAGNLYGATQYGGGYGSCNAPFYQHCGTVFELSPPNEKGGKWIEKVLYSFKGGPDGANPNGGLIFDKAGAIYGTTYAGGNQTCTGDGYIGCGTVFELSPPIKGSGSWILVALRRFDGYPADGELPAAGLALGADNAIYGTTTGGGNQAGGVAFKLTPSQKRDDLWVEKLIHQFTFGKDGAEPRAGLMRNGSGSLYGTASIGGAVGGGTVFELGPTQGRLGWSLVSLYSFEGAPDGSYPSGKLIPDVEGRVYVTTQQSGNIGPNCGNDGCGTVFELFP